MRRLERYGGFFTARGAAGLSLYFVVAAVATGADLGCAFAFAGLAAFGFVLELFVVEEKLFAGGKNEIGPTINALEGPILKFHLSRTSTPGAPCLVPDASAERRGSTACYGATSLGSAHRPIFRTVTDLNLPAGGRSWRRCRPPRESGGPKSVSLALSVPFSGYACEPELA